MNGAVAIIGLNALPWYLITEVASERGGGAVSICLIVYNQSQYEYTG